MEIEIDASSDFNLVLKIVFEFILNLYMYIVSIIDS